MLLNLAKSSLSGSANTLSAMAERGIVVTNTLVYESQTPLLMRTVRLLCPPYFVVLK